MIKCPVCDSETIRMEQRVSELWSIEEEEKDHTLKEFELVKTIPLNNPQKSVYCPDCGTNWTYENFERQYETHRLTKLLENNGFVAEDLDELVHEAYSNSASLINNSGIKAQISALLDFSSQKHVRTSIAQLLKKEN